MKQIYVRDGSRVKKGQVLLKLDDTRSAISLELSRSEVFQLMAIESRLVAERDNKSKITFPKRLIKAGNNPKVAQVVRTQQAIFRANAQALNGNVKILKQRISQLREQASGVAGQVKAYSRQLHLIREELKAVIYLQKRKLIDKPRLLALQRREADILGDRGENQARLAAFETKNG